MKIDKRVPKQMNNIKIKRNAIQSLVKDNSIVIKDANKGGGMDIMNIFFYKRKVLALLTDELYFQPVG